MNDDDSKFLIVKDKDSKEIRYFDYDKIDGYNLKAKKNSNYFDDINSINRKTYQKVLTKTIGIINPNFKAIADKKINEK